MPTLISRFRALPAASLDAALTLRPGSWSDYAALSRHHYKAQRPATAMRILVLEHRAPSVMDRFITPDLSLRRSGFRTSSGAGAVAVLIESLPHLSCKLRDAALGGRYRSLRDARQRAALLNAEVRCISRVIVDPRWRGLGLAVRLVRHALATATTPYTEALAAMGRVVPFFERAGMLAYHRPPHPHDARLADALVAAGFRSIDLAMLDRLVQRIGALPADRRAWLVREIQRWSRFAQRSPHPAATLREQLVLAQQRLLCEPVYYLKAHFGNDQGPMANDQRMLNIQPATESMPTG